MSVTELLMKTLQKDLVSFLSPVLKYIDTEIEAGRNVFVHCLAGAHRSHLTILLKNIEGNFYLKGGNNSNNLLNAFCRTGEQ